MFFILFLSVFAVEKVHLVQSHVVPADHSPSSNSCVSFQKEPVEQGFLGKLEHFAEEAVSRIEVVGKDVAKGVEEVAKDALPVLHIAECFIPGAGLVANVVEKVEGIAEHIDQELPDQNQKDTKPALKKDIQNPKVPASKEAPKAQVINAQNNTQNEVIKPMEADTLPQSIILSSADSSSYMSQNEELTEKQKVFCRLLVCFEELFIKNAPK